MHRPPGSSAGRELLGSHGLTQFVFVCLQLLKAYQMDTVFVHICVAVSKAVWRTGSLSAGLTTMACHHVVCYIIILSHHAVLSCYIIMPYYLVCVLQAAATGVCWAPNSGTVLYSCGKDAKLSVLDMRSQSEAGSVQGPEPFSCIGLRYDGRLLAAGTAGEMHVY